MAGCGDEAPEAASHPGGIGRGVQASCDLYAAHDGSESAPGTPIEAVSLRRAADRRPAAGPDRLLSGRHLLLRGHRDHDPGITLAAYRDEAATLEGEIKVRPAGAGTTIEGLTLNGASGASDIGPRIYADDVTLRDNEITNDHTSICVSIGRWYSRPPPQGW